MCFGSASVYVYNNETFEPFNLYIILDPVHLLKSNFFLKSEFRESELFFDIW
jgi:hypothetical protein